MKQYIIDDMHIVVTGRQFWIGEIIDDFDLAFYEECEFFEDESGDKFILSSSRVIKLHDNFPMWISDPFIFKALPAVESLEHAPQEQLKERIMGYLGKALKSDDDIARVKKLIKDQRYINKIEWIGSALAYDEADALVSHIGKFTIHHNRHNRSLDKKYIPIFIWRNHIYVCPSSNNANGIMLVDDGVVSIAKHGEQLIGICKF